MILIIGGLSVVILQKNLTTYRNEIISEANGMLNLELEVFDNIIANNTEDIRFLRLLAIKELSAKKQSTTEKMKHLQTDFYSFAKAHPNYDQIRYINDSGDEIIRINNRHGAPLLVSTKMLQNKKHRPYFHQTMQLPSHHIYISSLEANVEFDKIDIPIIPVMRVAAPVNFNNQTQGIVVINYNMAPLIKRIKSILVDKHIQTMLINRRGYFIIGPHASSEWGHIFKERKDQTLAKLYPKTWKQMAKQSNRKIISKNGIFLVRDLSVSIEKHISNVFSKGINLKLISFIPNKTLQPGANYYFAIILITFILIALVSFLWTIFRLKKLQYDDQMEKMATLDPLTQTANRNKLYKNIKNEIDRAKRLDQPLSLIMLDIDLFKQVNDRFGHIAGDKALKALSRSCEKLIRNIDTLGRFGGEEFIIVLPGTELSEAIVLAERICTETAKLKVPYQNESISFTISLGVATLHEDETMLESLLKRVDEALYAAKNRGRNRVVGEDQV